jgi:hypothetical protein
MEHRERWGHIAKQLLTNFRDHQILVSILHAMLTFDEQSLIGLIMKGWYALFVQKKGVK